MKSWKKGRLINAVVDANESLGSEDGRPAKSRKSTKQGYSLSVILTTSYCQEIINTMDCQPIKSTLEYVIHEDINQFPAGAINL